MNKIVKNSILRWRLIVTSLVICALIAFIISSLLPAKYQSDISMIVIQKQTEEKVDAFSATKSAEFLSNILSNVIYTTSFFSSVQDAPFEVKRDFAADPEEREKQWKKLIDVKKVNNTGILHISVRDVSRTTTEETAKAIAYILTTNSDEYHGGGDRVEVRLIDGPMTPLTPTVPHIWKNTGVGALFGIIIAVVFIYFFPDKIILSLKETDEICVMDDDDEEVDADLAAEYYAVQNNHDSIAENHFKNAQSAMAFSEDSGEKTHDPEVEALHERIRSFAGNE